LRRITGHSQLGSDHDVRASVRQLIVSPSDLLEIAAQVADRWINLGETDLHPRSNVMRGAKSGKNFAYFFSLPMTVRCS